MTFKTPACICSKHALQIDSRLFALGYPVSIQQLLEESSRILESDAEVVAEEERLHARRLLNSAPEIVER